MARDAGCNGGLPENAYKTLLEIGGLELESDYGHGGEDEACKFNRSKVAVRVTGGLEIPPDEHQMAQWLLKNGPISVAINAFAMQFYMGGVSHPFSFLCDPSGLDHGVLIVGFGVHTSWFLKRKIPYWIIKNSWGPSWGEAGYYRVYRGGGVCGLNTMASSATVEETNTHEEAIQPNMEEIQPSVGENPPSEEEIQLYEEEIHSGNSNYNNN